MKLSKLVKEISKISKSKNPEIRIVGEGGFLDIAEVLKRSDYYDEAIPSGRPFEKGNFICLEIERR